MKNNKGNSKVINAAMLTRKGKTGNEAKIQQVGHNGFSEKPISKKIKKERNTQQSDSESNISNITNNSENFKIPSDQINNHQETQKISIQQLNNQKQQEKVEEITNLTEPYKLLLSAAQDPDSISNSSQINQNLIDIKKFNQENATIVFLENTFAGQQMSISPAIFTRTNLQIKHNYSKNQEIIAFENYLNFVTWLYYKKKYKLNEQLINFDEFSSEKAREGKFKPYEKKKKSKNQGKKKNELNSINQAEESIEPKPEDIEQEFHQDILESLITPLRPALSFGSLLQFLIYFAIEHWSPKEIAIFETGICKFGKNFGFIQQLASIFVYYDYSRFNLKLRLK